MSATDCDSSGVILGQGRWKCLRWGTFPIASFAFSITNNNPPLGTDAFAMRSVACMLYVFPPLILLQSLVDKVCKEKHMVVLVATRQPRQTWFAELNIAGKWGSVGSADMQRPVDSSRRNILVSSPWELEAERGLLKVYPGQRCPSICLSGGCSWSSVLHRTRTHLHVLLKRFWRFLIKAILLLWCSVTDSTLSHSGIGCSFSGMHAEKGRISWGDILSSPSVKYGYTRNPTFYIISTSQWGYCRFIGGGK